jgi:RNA polymerase sigma-B factor
MAFAKAARRVAEAMRDLWNRARAGDRAARDRLIERHMPLARSLAVQYRHAREPLDDLVQVANLGLVKAVDRFDPDRGIAFTSYAVPTILGELKRHFRDRTWTIHLSRSVQESIARVDRATEALRPQLGHDPSAREVAQHCGMSIEDVIEARLADGASRTSSLDAPVRREEGDLSDLLGRNDAGLDRVEDALWIEQLAGSLTSREREVLRLRFVEDLVQREIAERVGISQMHVSRVLRQALAHLADAA